ncbi:unnamed protein product [Lactuca virosa]|uniref:Reverse transcriptase zinc-binding domain-containing protein n=1 Tax=Lactuca virosa TaxID=75947 RepID=A0AAU9NSU9_9ASTR|nr:unnamed protein product [Lactuca virosa]
MKEVPLKVLCFIWRAKWGRVPSAQALISRGFSNISPNCGYCNHTDEISDHIFIHCDFASAVREWIMRWCGVTLAPINTVEDLLEFASNWSQCPKKHKVFMMICYGLIWCLWKARNDIIFKQVKASPTKIVDDIQALVFFWLKHRGSLGAIRWCDWCISPFACL